MWRPYPSPVDGLLSLFGGPAAPATFSFGRQLNGHSETAEFDRGRVCFAGQQNAVRLNVTVNDVVLMAVLKRQKDLPHVVAEKNPRNNVRSPVIYIDQIHKNVRMAMYLHTASL